MGVKIFFIKCFGWTWRAIAGVLDFLSLLQERRAGQPNRINLGAVMVWGAMIICSMMFVSGIFSGSITLTEMGFGSIISVLAGLIMRADGLGRDRNRHDRGGPDREY